MHGRWCDIAWCAECDEQRMICHCGESEENWDDIWDGFNWLSDESDAN